MDTVNSILEHNMVWAFTVFISSFKKYWLSYWKVAESTSFQNAWPWLGPFPPHLIVCSFNISIFLPFHVICYLIYTYTILIAFHYCRYKFPYILGEIRNCINQTMSSHIGEVLQFLICKAFVCIKRYFPPISFPTKEE